MDFRYIDEYLFIVEGEHKHLTDNAILTHVNDSWYGVSRYPPTKIPSVNVSGEAAPNPQVAAGLSLNPSASEYKVSVSGSQNADGYVTASQVEARYPVGQLPAYPPPMSYYQNAAVANASQSQNPVYQKLPTSENTLPSSQQTYGQAQPQAASQQPGPALKAPKETSGNDILDLKLEQRPVLQSSKPQQQIPVAAVGPAATSLGPQPAPQKIPSAKNYPIDLFLLAQPGAKQGEPAANHQLTSVKLTAPAGTATPGLVESQKMGQNAPVQPFGTQQSQVSQYQAESNLVSPGSNGAQKAEQYPAQQNMPSAQQGKAYQQGRLMFV